MRKASLAVLSLCSLASLLAGCTSGVRQLSTLVAQSASMGGSVHGGNQPVSGATIQIYAPGTTGYGSAPTALITGAPLLTAADGSFNFGNRSLTCPSGPTGQDRLYLTATGGNPGFGGTVNNDALFLMTIIDNCQALTSSSFFSVSEVSTVTSIYALAQFMNTTTGSIGSYGYATTGLNNAFDLAVTLFNPATGLANTVTSSGGGNGLVPQTTIDTLANIITPCVNSTGSTSAACAALFPLTTNTTPSNTGLAALQMALHPGTNAGTLYTLAQANAPFQPALTTAPSDLTVSVAYHTGVSQPSGMALDGSGNVWMADYETGTTTSRLLKVTPQGVSTIFSNNTNGISKVAVDSQNNVWAIDPADNFLTEFNNAGSAINTVTATRGASGALPKSIAIDAGGNPWVTDTMANVSEFNVANSQTVAFGGSLSSPANLSFDSSGNAWIPNSGANSLSEINAAGIAVGTFTGGGMSTPTGTAIDGSGNVYVGNAGGIALSEFNSSGSAVSSTGYTNAVLGGDFNVAVDGSGHVWSTGNNNRLAELYNGALVSPAAGYKSPGINQPGGIGVDASGNVWVMDSNHVSVNGTFVNLVNFVGIATPAVTPLATAVRNAQVGAAAGTPIPVAVASTALPYYTSGIAYTATLVASGGSGAYTWTSGTLPAGLSLSSAGVITGTPSGAGGPVNFTVTDTALGTNTATRSITLNANTALPSGANTANLSGQFAVLLKGFRNSTPSTTGTLSGYGVIGSLTFDGAGNVTGAMDYNGYNGSALNQSMTGTYTVGSDLRGFLLLKNGASTGNAMIPKQLAFSVANNYNTLYLTDMDSTTTTGPSVQGIAKLQTPSQFNGTTMNKSWVLGLDGETTCIGTGSTCGTAISPYYGTMSMAGRIAITNTTSISGVMDMAALNKSYPGTALTGSYNVPSGTIGRGSMQLPASTTVLPNYGSLFLYYVVNSNEVFLMTALSHTTVDLLVGEMIVQSQTFSGTASANANVFNGRYVLSGTGSVNGNGTSTYPYATDNILVGASSGGTGTLTAIQDENQSGLISTENSLGTLGYSIDGNGRMTLTQGTNTAPVTFYLASSTSGFGTQAPSASNGGEPGLIKIDQVATMSVCSILSGGYSFGSYPPTVPQTISSGMIDFTGLSGSATVDSSSPSGILNLGATDTFNCTEDALTPTYGRISYADALGQTNVGYITAAGPLILLDATANQNKGGIKIATEQ